MSDKIFTVQTNKHVYNFNNQKIISAKTPDAINPIIFEARAQILETKAI